jgi:phosphotransferase system enzyme I (PtsI)
MPREPTPETRWTGLGLAPGIAIAPLRLYKRDEPAIPERRLAEDEVEAETKRLETALLHTRQELLDIRARLAELGGEGAAIFEAHLLTVDDPAIVEDILRHICDSRECAERAVILTAERYAALFRDMEDDYLRERATDVRDVARRILRNLAALPPAGAPPASPAAPSSAAPDAPVFPPSPCILAARDLSPSDTVALHRPNVLGIVLANGSPTSHVAILTRAMGIPAVTRVGDAFDILFDTAPCILDGTRGTLVLHPTPETLRRYNALRDSREAIRTRLEELRPLSATTLDGHHVPLLANIELPTDVPDVTRRGAEGVGLYRTEYLFLADEPNPDEQTQYLAYANAARTLAPAPVILRTVDLGGDKLTPELRRENESNPFLGWRAIRFCLARPDMFKAQLRAILRAGALNPNLSLMYPMVSRLGEVLAANALLAECKAELAAAGIPHNPSIRVGIMVEIPSAALSAAELAKHVDFFSIGTNDLTQYTLAVDRGNEHVANLYDPAHPAVLRLVKMTIDAATAASIPVGLCGEMAGNPLYALLLVGLGTSELSVTPLLVPIVKEVIRNATLAQCRDLAERALLLPTGDEVRDLCRDLLSRVAPHILKLTD